ncbi:MAG TPA: peptidylprolyl isomerase [Streptosporangiaceae bacterium]|jgi:peptidyl-prolyl cis-trans isomerase B (cyclophilin B)
MRKRQVFTFVAATLALGLTGAASASALSQAPASPGQPRTVAQARVSGPAVRAQAKAPAAGTAPADSCGFTTAVPFDRFKGLPDFTPAKAAQPYTARLHTTQGLIVIRALTAQAPCTTFSFRFLAQRGYFTKTHCHRLTTQGIFVLQCGDPTGTGSGGPGYKFNDENLAGATYPAGTVAMANAGPDTNGSQFFFVWKDTKLAPDFTPFATVVSGMDVLQKIAAAGDDSQNGPGDGYPNRFTEFGHIQIVSGK